VHAQPQRLNRPCAWACGPSALLVVFITHSAHYPFAITHFAQYLIFRYPIHSLLAHGGRLRRLLLIRDGFPIL